MKENDFKIATLIYPIQDNKILLGIKQKKVSAGLWSGYGGKPELQDASIYETAIREIYEETGEGLICTENDLEPAAVIDFTLEYSERESFYMRVYIFRLEKYTGTYVDTSEMRQHTWFPFGQIPYDDMLPDNTLFLPELIQGRYFIGEIVTQEGVVVENDIHQKTQDELIKLFGSVSLKP